MSILSRAPAVMVLGVIVSVLLLHVIWRAEGRRGLWLDEMYSLQLSRGSGYAHRDLPLATELKWHALNVIAGPERLLPGQVWTNQVEDSHPPLYFVVLHLWRWLVGDSIAAARVLSFLISALSTVTAFALCRACGLSVMSGGLAGGVLVAAWPFAWMGSELRGYGLGMLFVVCGLGSLMCLVETGKTREHRRKRLRTFWAVLWSVSMLGAALTHYFAVGPLFGALLAALCSKGYPHRQLIIATCAVLMIFSVIWLPALVGQLGRIEGYSGWIKSAGRLDAAAQLSAVLGVPNRVLGGPGGLGSTLTGAAVFTLALGGALGGAAPRFFQARVLFGGLVGATALPLLADLTLGSVHLWQVRYLIFALPPIAFLSGLLWSTPQRLRWTAWAIAAVAILGMTERVTTESDWMSVARYAERRWQVGNDAEKSGLMFIVDRADEQTGRLDRETDVRLLAALINANWSYLGELRAKRGEVTGHPDSKVVLLDNPDPVTGSDSCSMDVWPTLRDHVDQWIAVVAWRYDRMSEYFPGWQVVDSQWWPEMNVRVLVWVQPRSRATEGDGGTSWPQDVTGADSKGR